MPNAVHRFKDRDIKRVVKAVRASGEAINRIEVDPRTGKVCVVVGAGGVDGSKTELDEWMTKHARSTEGN